MRKNVPLLGVLAAALVLRVLFLQSRSIIYDDAFSISLAQQSLGNIISGTAADTMPPLYYFLLHFWLKISQELWFLRMLSVLLSLGSVYLLYCLTSEIFNPIAGLWAGLLAAVSPLQLYHAQDIRMYALVLFAQLAYAWFFYRLFWSKKSIYDRWWNWAGLILSGTAAMYSHNLAIFGLLVSDFLLLWRRDWKNLVRLFAAQAAIALLALPWLFLVPGQVEKIQRAFWTPRPGLIEVFQAFLLFTLQLPLSTIAMFVGAILSAQILVTVVLAQWKDPKRSTGTVFFSSFALVLPLMLFVVSYLIRPVFVARGFLLASMAYYALIGRTIERLWSRGIGMFLAGAFVVCAAISLPAFYQFEEFPRSPFADAGHYLETTVQPEDLVLHDNKLSYFPMQYFDPNLPQGFLPDQPGSPNDTLAPATQQAMSTFPLPDLQSAIGQHPTVYFVVFQTAIEEYRDLGERDHPSLIWLGDHLTLESIQTFGDLDVYVFQQ